MVDFSRFTGQLSKRTIWIVAAVTVLVLGVIVWRIVSPAEPKFDPVEARKQGEYQGKAMEEYYKAHPPPSLKPTGRS